MYSARISRKSPALFVVLIDQSGSMEEPTSLYGRTVSKAEAVAATVNMLLGELLNRSRREGVSRRAGRAVTVQRKAFGRQTFGTV